MKEKRCVISIQQIDGEIFASVDTKKIKYFSLSYFVIFQLFLFGFKITICLFSLMCFGIKKQKKERHQHNAWFHLAKKAIYQVVTNSLNAVTFVVH